MPVQASVQLSFGPFELPPTPTLSLPVPLRVPQLAVGRVPRAGPRGPRGTDAI